MLRGTLIHFLLFLERQKFPFKDLKNQTEKNKVEEIMFFKPALTTATHSCPTWEYPSELWS